MDPNAVLQKLLDFSQPMDVPLLDQLVNAMYTGAPRDIETAQKILNQFQQHNEAWLRVANILEVSTSSNTKFFALSVLESVIKYRWKVLPREQCEGIKNYIVNLIIKLSSEDTTMHRERVFVAKLNKTLVEIIKQEWPRNWQSFIPEIVGSSKASESLCENNMNILKLLSEEVFDFSNGEMTQAKIKELKTSFNSEFALIYQLCEFVLQNSSKPSLISATLKTLLRFLNWIPLGYIFETTMLQTLIHKFFPVPQFRNDALKCLSEVGALSLGSMYVPQFEALFVEFMQQLVTVMPVATSDIPGAYARGTEDVQNFIQDLCLFFSGFFKVHLGVIEAKPEYHGLLVEAHKYLVEISKVDETEIFKACVDYWCFLAQDIYTTEKQRTPLGIAPGLKPPPSPRKALYAPVLSAVRSVLVTKMAKPEEVLIVEDENGEFVREYMKDVDAIQMYKNMREALIFLTNIDPEDMETIMLDKLTAQMDGSERSLPKLNSLCWAIGSISGSMPEEDEKRFLVTVIRDLLGLCEMVRHKENKAVVASNIMYVVGQYPRFLKAHWKFLKTVVNKLFEFMHETFPGVQDMACDTFLKISQKCKRKFVQLQPGETMPFIEEILLDLPGIIAHRDGPLETQQVHVFYEALGWMISSGDRPHQEPLVTKYMELPNKRWSEIMAMAAADINNLRRPEIMKDLGNLLKTNVRGAVSLGNTYHLQLRKIFLEMLNVYKAYSSMITAEVAANPATTKHSHVRAMRTVKKETLRLVETFIEKCEDVQEVYKIYIPPLLEAVLTDFRDSVPDARDAEVLSLMAQIINKMKAAMTPEVPRILNAVFEVTLQMITKNFEDFPEHRLNFFNLLKAINSNCFQAYFAIPAPSFKLVMDSIVWAFKHTERNIAETGLLILLDFLKAVQVNPEVANAFHQTFFLPLLSDVFVVLTDTFHKPGFKHQAAILMHMFHIVESGQVTAPLFDTTKEPAGTTNQLFLRRHMATMLSSFPNLTQPQIQQFVIGLFDMNKDLPAFKSHLRDFLVQLKEFSSSDNADLFDEVKDAQQKQQEAEQARRAAVPGLIAPHDRPDVGEMAE